PTFKNLRPTFQAAKNQGRPYHAIHFLGHGGFDESGSGQLWVERSDRRGQAVRGQEVMQQLQGFDELRLAVLSTCVGARMARRRGQHPFTGSASALVAGGLSAVVAMQFPVSERAAGEFPSAFYQHLASGRALEEAVTEGRLRIGADEAGTVEWASPVLFLRARDGQVFVLDRPAKRPATAGP